MKNYIFVLLCFWINHTHANEVRNKNSLNILALPFVEDASDKHKPVMFSPAYFVPLKVGVSYGWIVKVPQNINPVHFKEVVTLENLPKSFTSQMKETAFSSDGHSATTEFVRENSGNGIFSRPWYVDSNDTLGKMVIELWIENIQVGRFQFEAVEKLPASVRIVPIVVKN